MNPHTGHLVAIRDHESIARGYVSVPAGPLAAAASRKLAGRDEAYVSLTSGGRLSRFAAEQRRADRQKDLNRSRNKAARTSRRRNRN